MIERRGHGCFRGWFGLLVGDSEASRLQSTRLCAFHTCCRSEATLQIVAELIVDEEPLVMFLQSCRLRESKQNILLASCADGLGVFKSQFQYFRTQPRPDCGHCLALSLFVYAGVRQGCGSHAEQSAVASKQERCFPQLPYQRIFQCIPLVLSKRPWTGSVRSRWQSFESHNHQTDCSVRQLQPCSVLSC